MALRLCPILCLLCSTAAAQVGPLRVSRSSSQFELSETVQIDRADGTVLAHLERVKACLTERQWDEAVETLRQLMESAEGKLLEVAPGHFVNLSDACQRQLAALPSEALKLYRSRIDPVAQKWYEEGAARRDAILLNNVVRQAFASSFGDKALMALGEIYLEEGNFEAARWCWERILPVHIRPGEISTWPGYPDSTLDPAAVRARLVLVSALEGSTERARDELSRFVRLHGEARGRLAGREVRYAAELADLLNKSKLWPRPSPAADWPTFAGSPERNAIAPEVIDVAAVQWRKTFGHSGSHAGEEADAPPGAAAKPTAPLAYHPVVNDGRIFVADENQVFGFYADTGGPAWGDGEPTIYREVEDAPATMSGAGPVFGTPRYSLTIADGRLYARMGTPITNPPQQPGIASSGGSIVCMDLRAEGKLLWRASPEDGWAFDGVPVVAGARMFVVMRHADIRPQAHVACFDTTTGRMRWRRFICAAETPARAEMPECTHNLLTFAGGMVYVNTNLGAVAAVAADSGRINWLSLYPRTRRGDIVQLDPHWSRELNPCLFDRGRLYVAPADSPRVYAFDAFTGQILWPGRHSDRATGDPVQDPLDDVVDLLGVRGDCLIASGYRLYWINLDGPRAGNIAHVWPDGPDRLGFGRGIVTPTQVYWPTRDKIYVFDPLTARLKKEIELGPLGVHGGNLTVAGGHLLIAIGGELVMLSTSGAKEKPQPEIVKR
jgi:outer membrane protein assembly factor BamB